MAQKSTDALIKLRRDDVFEAAGLLVDFGFIDGEGVGEEAFGEAVATNYIAGAA